MNVVRKLAGINKLMSCNFLVWLGRNRLRPVANHDQNDVIAGEPLMVSIYAE